MNDINFKVVMLGEGRVGKTSLTLKYIHDTFNPDQISSVNASYSEKKLNIGSDQVKMAIWVKQIQKDTAGQEKFKALAPMYYRDANGAVLVYDITYKESMDQVVKWLRELKSNASSDIKIVIAGNKADIKTGIQVPEETGIELAKKVGAKHFLTSARTGLNVNEAFDSLAKQIYEGQGRQVVSPESKLMTSNVFKINKKKTYEPQTKKKSNCC